MTREEAMRSMRKYYSNDSINDIITALTTPQKVDVRRVWRACWVGEVDGTFITISQNKLTKAVRACGYEVAE